MWAKNNTEPPTLRCTDINDIVKPCVLKCLQGWLGRKMRLCLVHVLKPIYLLPYLKLQQLDWYLMQIPVRKCSDSTEIKCTFSNRASTKNSASKEWMNIKSACFADKHWSRSLLVNVKPDMDSLIQTASPYQVVYEAKMTLHQCRPMSTSVSDDTDCRYKTRREDCNVLVQRQRTLKQTAKQ